MRVLVCGAAPRKRTGDPGWTDPWAILRELRKLPSDTVVIHGAAKGADHLAGEMAFGIGLEVIAVPAHWTHSSVCPPRCTEYEGRGAGPIRNRKMLAMKPDLVLAFHVNIEKSKGTRDMVALARGAGIETHVFTS